MRWKTFAVRGKEEELASVVVAGLRAELMLWELTDPLLVEEPSGGVVDEGMLLRGKLRVHPY